MASVDPITVDPITVEYLLKVLKSLSLVKSREELAALLIKIYTDCNVKTGVELGEVKVSLEGYILSVSAFGVNIGSVELPIVVVAEGVWEWVGGAFGGFKPSATSLPRAAVELSVEEVDGVKVGFTEELVINNGYVVSPPVKNELGDWVEL